MGSSSFVALRKAVLARDGFKCRECGEHANEVDHIRPVSLGGADTEDNLRAICRPCNSRKWRNPVGPLAQQPDDPECSHCHLGKVAHVGLCRSCYRYRGRTGVLPPATVLERRMEALVVATHSDPTWVPWGKRQRVSR